MIFGNPTDSDFPSNISIANQKSIQKNEFRKSFSPTVSSPLMFPGNPTSRGRKEFSGLPSGKGFLDLTLDGNE